METHLRAGMVIYNAGEYHAAHDAWESHWLDLTKGTDDERFLHGLIQFTAAVYHARNGNWSGATGLAESAREYLTGLPETYRGVNVGAVRRYLDRLEADPERVERAQPLSLTDDGHRVAASDLGLDATIVAATVLAEEYGFDESVIERAGRYATADVDDETTRSPFVTFLFDFVREPENRPIVVQRLTEHVERRSHREDDVSGLFETDE
jgi:predicted metal-dependent hydrolase